MKKIYLLSILSLIFNNNYAQTFDWAIREGLDAYDYGYGVVTDNNGDLFVAGKYEMAANFSGTILPDRGNHDIYLAKYSTSGTLSWITTAGGGLGDYAHALATDGTNLYVAGEIEGYGNTINFANSAITLSPLGDNDAFLAKYDGSGNLIWAKSAGYYYNDKALGVACDPSGNVYICGIFEDTAIFEGTTIYGYGNGSKDMFIAKYDANGAFQWVRHGVGPGREEALSIKCDSNGNVYVCGFYSNGAVFETQTLTAPNGYFESYLAKYSPVGGLVWIKTSGGDYDDVSWGITIDNTNKIYVTGEFNAYAHFDAIALTTSGNADVFVACYDDAGAVQWAKPAGGTLIDRARGIGTDGANVYITGQFGNTAAFGSYSVSAADSSDIFIAAMNTAGDFVWAASVSGPPDSVETLSYESGNSVCSRGGYVYATGALLNGGVFGNTALNPYSRTDMFLTRLSQQGVSIEELTAGNQISISPNPGTGNFVFDLGKNKGQKFDVNVFNSIGQIVYKKTNKSSDMSLDLSYQEKGIYFIELKTEDQKVYREKLIIQ